MPRISLFALGLVIAPALAVLPSNTAPGTADYTIQVENTMGHDMDFFYSDADSTEHTLGAIPGYLRVTFTIKSPARTAITVIERGAAMGTDYEMKKEVQLVDDST